MSDDDQQQLEVEPNESGTRKPKWSLYNKHVAQAWKDQQASSDAFDKNLLTISTAALGLSLTVIKDLVPFKDAAFKDCLYFSWIAFTVCIVSTVFSFPVSVQAQKTHAENLYKYYIERKDEYRKGHNRWETAVGIFSWISGSFFLAGIIATVIFAIENVSRIH